MLRGFVLSSCLALVACGAEPSSSGATPIGSTRASAPEAQSAASATPPASGGAAHGAPNSVSTVEPALSNAPLEPFQAELLGIAFDAASAQPAQPHLKSRSLAQEKVVATCLELKQTQSASVLADKIDNWRRGSAYADLALHCLESGDRGPHIQRFLDLALAEAEAPESEIGQSWRRDRIKAKIAQAKLVLGETELAAMYSQGLEPAEAGRVAAFESGLMPEERFEGLLSVLDHGVQAGNFDVTLYALETVKQLYRRFYADAERRELLEQKLESYWKKAPFALRIDALLAFAETSLDHGDTERGRATLNRTLETAAQAVWRAADYAPVMSRAAKNFHRLGDSSSAARCLSDAFEKYESEREQIWNFERATVLRPLAEGQAAVGDRSGALATYRRAIEEGAENPNARPRAEDLAATCCSMARAAVEPDAELFARIREIRTGLVDPW